MNINRIDKFDADKVFFTSDTHFFHERIIEYCQRPFKSVDEMNEALINNWNSAVPTDGIVFHLGDFAKGDSAIWSDIISRLNGHIHLIAGNHDWPHVLECLEGYIEDITAQKTIQVGRQKILLCHYPLLTYPGVLRNEWQLFGHCHLNPNMETPTRLRLLLPTQYDVGVDNNNYAPISYHQLRRIIEQQIIDARMHQDSDRRIITS